LAVGVSPIATKDQYRGTDDRRNYQNGHAASLARRHGS
jgi:hypothetical protein